MPNDLLKGLPEAEAEEGGFVSEGHGPRPVLFAPFRLLGKPAYLINSSSSLYVSSFSCFLLTGRMLTTFLAISRKVQGSAIFMYFWVRAVAWVSKLSLAPTCRPQT